MPGLYGSMLVYDPQSNTWAVETVPWRYGQFCRVDTACAHNGQIIIFLNTGDAYARASDGSWSLYEPADLLPQTHQGSYALGSVVLQWTMDAREFYYPALVDGETHVYVNHETLAPTVKRLEQDESLAKHLVEGAAEVDEKISYGARRRRPPPRGRGGGRRRGGQSE